MVRQRNNIYAVAADAVDLALDTAGTIGSMVGGVAHMIGIGSSEQEERERKEADDAGGRVAATKPRSHKARGSKKKTVKARTRRVAA